MFDKNGRTIEAGDVVVKRNKYLTDDEKKEIIADYNKGVQLRDICKKYDISTGGITYVLRENGLEPSRANKSNTNGTKALMAHNNEISKVAGENSKNVVKMYKQGNSVKDIAKTLDCSLNAVYQTLRRNNVQLRQKTARGAKRHEISNAEQLEIVKDYQDGLTMHDICIKHDTCSNSVYTYLDIHGVKRRESQKCRGKEDRNINKKEIISFYESGISKCQIAKRTKLSQYTVTHILNANRAQIR